MGQETLYEIQIRDGKKRTYDKRRELHEFGFDFTRKSKRNKYWIKKSATEAEVEKAKAYCVQNRFQITVISDKFLRSSDYRKEFFKHYKPFFKDKYFCIYCGRLIPEKVLTIDHIIPIHKAGHSPFIQRYLKKKNIENINDHRNLGASCAHCNLSKGSKTGLWVLRGKLGRSNLYQLVRWVLRVVCLGMIIFLLIGIVR